MKQLFVSAHITHSKVKFVIKKLISFALCDIDINVYIKTLSTTLVEKCF